MSNIFEIVDLKKSFDDLNVLNGISLNIKQGEIVCILGTSGGGKSTFLRCLNLLETPTSGSIFFKETDIVKDASQVDELRKHVGMVFQQFNLFNNLNVLKNCTIAQTQVLKRNKEEAMNIAIEKLKAVGMIDFIESKVTKLSGGQKQRVAIARALCMNPDVLLFDEPTSALDPEMVGEVLSTIKKLANENMTLIIVTHEMKFARDVATRIIFIDKGLVAQDCTPKEFFSSENKNERVKEFLKNF